MTWQYGQLETQVYARQAQLVREAEQEALARLARAPRPGELSPRMARPASTQPTCPRPRLAGQAS